MQKRILALLFITAVFQITACKKNSDGNGSCDVLSNAHLSATKSVTIGEPIGIYFPDLDNVLYSWYGPNNFNGFSNSAHVDYAELKHEGWYYISASNSDCGSKQDSVYIDVKLKQGTPSCSIADNNATYNNMSDDSFSYLTKGIESTYSLFSLNGWGNGNLTIYFHPEWRNKEPEDGIYTTTNVVLFDPVDANYDKVFVTTTKQGIYWSSYADQQVYVSHAGGKLQVRYCNLQMGGNNGSSYTTVASGNILEQ